MTSAFFLPIARRSRSAGRACSRASTWRDLHDLLLVDDDAVGVLEDRLQRRVRVLDLLAPVLAVDEVVDHAALERTRAVERAGGDDVLEAVGLELLQQLA